jgi:hypothetical protein
MAKKRRSDTPEFKTEAVKLVTAQGYSTAEPARSASGRRSSVPGRRPWQPRAIWNVHPLSIFCVERRTPFEEVFDEPGAKDGRGGLKRTSNEGDERPAVGRRARERKWRKGRGVWSPACGRHGNLRKTFRK